MRPMTLTLLEPDPAAPEESALEEALNFVQKLAFKRESGKVLSDEEVALVLALAHGWLTELAEVYEIMSAPRCVCSSCGESDPRHFVTVKSWTDYGYEYDIQCKTCGDERVISDPDEDTQFLADLVVKLQDRVKELEEKHGV